MAIKRKYNDLGLCPNCDNCDVYVYTPVGRPTGYFARGDEVCCVDCGHDGEMVEKIDVAKGESYMSIKWGEV